MSGIDVSQYTVPNDSEVVLLECKTAFDALTKKEKLYAHYLSQAAWNGGLIVLLQTSPESPGIYLLLQKLFKAQPVSELQNAAAECGLDEEERKAFLVYASAVYSNMGNYKSFGDTKIIPNFPKEKFEKLVLTSAASKADPDGVKKLWEAVKEPMYSLVEGVLQLGLGTKGINTYFSGNCDERDAELAQKFLNSQDISPYNTRLFKLDDKTYEVRLASAALTDAGSNCPEDVAKVLGKHEFTPEGSSSPVTFKVTRGDYSKLMGLVVENLRKAKEYAANENEAQMLDNYVKSFSSGSIPFHKEGSRYWIKDKGPIVETYIGFIESYRDPFGTRGEFEGFVSMVNKAMSAKFASLVANAETLLPELPWPKEYEKDTFLRPDFTSLDVLVFGGSGIPAGINIPNYDDIRQSEGFKNVSLGNVLTSQYKETDAKPPTFLEPGADLELYKKFKIPAFEVQVGLHELLGHGSGKLFIKDVNGKFNFDIENVKHTETGHNITTWYEHNETWDIKFQQLSSSYEECRAECVALYLCNLENVLKIFGFEGQEAKDVCFINWLNMVRAGLLGLEFYTPSSKTWRQAHMQARYVILQVLLEAGNDFVTLTNTTGADSKPDIVIKLDRSKIESVGKPAIGNFLRKLQVYKATADYASGKAMYDKYSAVSDDTELKFLTMREVVLARKQPRKMFVQCNTVEKDGDVMLQEYEASPTGLAESWVDRFPSTTQEDIIQKLWENDKKFF